VKLKIEKPQMFCGVTFCGFYSFHPMGELLKTVKPLRYKRLNRFHQTSFTDSGKFLRMKKKKSIKSEREPA